jgi:hypothetical protein
MRARWGATILAGALVACGISAVGQRASDSTALDASVDAPVRANDDAESDANVEPTPMSCDGGLGVVFLPEGTAVCPSGTTESTTQTDPLPSPGACSCGACTPTANPTCNVGAISVDYGDTASCAVNTLAYPTASESCTDFGLGTVTQAPYEKWQARAPAGGACTAAAITDTTKATSTTIRRCVATTAEAACLPSSTVLRKCVESSAPCGGEYSIAIVVGDGAAASCAECTCTRGATKCVVEHFTDGACTQLRYQQDLDGACQRTDDATNVHYFKVRAEGLTCVASPGAASAALTNPKTLCCIP